VSTGRRCCQPHPASAPILSHIPLCTPQSNSATICRSLRSVTTARPLSAAGKFRSCSWVTTRWDQGSASDPDAKNGRVGFSLAGGVRRARMTTFLDGNEQA
jgi:hypothetical protein